MPSYTHKPKNNVKGLAHQTGADLDNILDDALVVKNDPDAESKRRNAFYNYEYSDPNHPSNDPRKIKEFNNNGDGKGNEIVKNLNDKKDYGKLSISGSKRFNYLQKLYNKVKDIPGVENNPKFHKLVKKLSRKYPRMINRLERAKESSEKVRQQTANELSTNPEVASITEITTSGMDAWNNFNKNVWSKKNYGVDIQTNEDDKLGGKDGKEQIIQKYSADENLGPRLGTNPNLGSDISAALKNKKW